MISCISGSKMSKLNFPFKSSGSFLLQSTSNNIKDQSDLHLWQPDSLHSTYRTYRVWGWLKLTKNHIEYFIVFATNINELNQLEQIRWQRAMMSDRRNEKKIQFKNWQRPWWQSIRVTAFSMGFLCNFRIFISRLSFTNESKGEMDMITFCFVLHFK